MRTLNFGQKVAVEEITRWLRDKRAASPFFVLAGAAGTGKTFVVQELQGLVKGRFIYTAPTNKAAKVLREAVSTDSYKAECRTTYSLLGLRLEANGEVRELTAPEDPVDLSAYTCVVVDEGSMVNENLLRHVKQAAEEFHIKFLFLGDDAQLPPVGEASSKIWEFEQRALLTQIMRHDNQILAFATELRGKIGKAFPKLTLRADNAEGKGVFLAAGPLFERAVREAARRGQFSTGSGAKLIAWRNVTVDSWNKIIRQELFPEAGKRFWLPGDRAIFTAPGKDLDDEPMVTTDDEGEVQRVEVDWHPAHPDIKVYRIRVALDTGKVVTAFALHEEGQATYARRLNSLSDEARANSRRWKYFWEFKESFHSLRHAYAITAHRAQGSTYSIAFVNWRDILLNQNTQEAYRCLYVACTRPKDVLFLN